MKIPTDTTIRKFIYELIDWSQAESIVDVGCGNGYDLRELATYAGPNASLIGIDKSGTASESALSNGSDRLSFMQADIACGIPCADQSFDVVFSNNVLECVTDKPALLKEFARVLRPSGQVVCAHYDWDLVAIDGDDKALVRLITHMFADWKQAWAADCDAWMGRRLYRTFTNSGFFQGQVVTKVLTETTFSEGTYGWEMINSFRALVRRNMISEEEFQRFYNSVEQLAARGEYLFAITMFVYVGRAS